MPSSRHRPMPPLRKDDDRPLDIGAIVEENAKLRELVIQLSKLVVKNVVKRK